MSEAKRRIAEAVRVGRISRHIFLCADQTGPERCALEAGLASREHLVVRHSLGQEGP